MSILLTAQDKEIEELVGSDRLSVVEDLLARNRQHIEHRVQTLIERAKQRMGLHQSGRMTARQEAEWAATSDPFAALGHHTEAICPACGASGELEGQEVLNYEYAYDEESSRPVDRVSVDHAASS